MSMTIGRCSLSENPYHGTFRQRGDDVSFESEIVGADVYEMQARVQQLRGLMNNADEDTFPFTWSEDSTFDGFYRNIEVEIQDSAAMLSTGLVPFSIRMTRVAGGFARPLFETVGSSVVRTNAHGVTAPSGIFAVAYRPSSAEGSYWVSSGNMTTEDGVLNYSLRTAPVATESWTAWVKPSEFYLGQARLEIKYGSTWYPVHGKQIPSEIGWNWRINNGLCRAYPVSVDNGSYYWGGLTVETYNNGAGGWEGRTFHGGTPRFSHGLLTAPESYLAESTPYRIHVLRNSPEMVIVRATQRAEGAYTDFTIRRGDAWVEITRKYPIAASEGIACFTATASTAFTGGLKATAADANGNKYMIACHSAVTVDAGIGVVDLTTATTNPSTYLVTPNFELYSTTDTTVRNFLLAVRNERQRVVAR